MGFNTDKRIGTKVPDFIRREDSPGVRFDSGPYIGKIKNNLDGTMSGRLQVWIPDLGGDESSPLNWRTVSFASPFFGASSLKPDDKEKSYTHTRHTYGMWFTPPDIDNFVLCTFVAGDPLRGFWFACVPAQIGHHMVPAIASTSNYDDSKASDSTAKQAAKGSGAPVVEFNENAEESWEDFATKDKPIHEDHFKSIVEQGLNEDTTRGIITSSSQRESPSSVFGISTPGRPISEDDQYVYGRKGGHTFVMDDGDYQDKNKLVRLRSSAGHQIMMNDTEEVLHIINSKGTVWIELDKDGNLNVYAEKDLNIRAKGDFNFHSDKNMYIHAEGTFKLCAKKEMNIEADSIISLTKQTTKIYGNDVEIGSEGKISLNPKGQGSFSCDGELILKGSKIKLNSGDGPTVDKPDPIDVKDHADTEKQGVDWKSQDGKKKSIVQKFTSHEPWPRDASGSSNPAAGSAASASGVGNNSGSEQNASKPGAGKKTMGYGNTPGSAGTGTGGVNVNQDGSTDWSGPAGGQDAGPKSATGKEVGSRAADPSYMYRSDNPSPTKTPGSLSETETKALKTQLGYSENGFKYGQQYDKNGNPINPNFTGKYQMGSAALTDLGYIKPDAYAKYGSSAVQYPSSWTGKDGMRSRDDFLGSPSVQERSMDDLLSKNYNTLVKTGGIKSSDDNSTVSGMLATSHLLGPGGATTWRNTGVGQDANRTTGGTYFNLGRYANSTLASRG